MINAEAIKPIETWYQGYRFRSRLEARWAVFFNALGLRWAYEPEGFELPGGGRYLPDFRVLTPQGNSIWYEVKHAGVVTDPKFEKFRDSLSVIDKDGGRTEVKRASILSGDPLGYLANAESQEAGRTCPRCGLLGDPAYGGGCQSCPGAEFRFGCQSCDFETPSGGYHPYEEGLRGLSVTQHKGDVLIALVDWCEFVIRKLHPAARAARSARFECGETRSRAR